MTKDYELRLSSPEVDAEGSEISSAARLWRPVKDLITPSNFKVCKTSRDDNSFKLFFQKSTGNSTRPQVDLALCTIGYFFLHQDISYL
jgi:hypothetical protein